MRKVLSLVLVAVLALGMGMSAFAFDYDNIKGFATGYTLADGVTSASNVTINTTRRSVDLGTRYAMDEPTLNINLWTWLFDGSSYTSNLPGAAEYFTVDVNAMIRAGALPNYGTGAPVPNTWPALQSMMGTATDLNPNYFATTYTNITDNTVRAAQFMGLYQNRGFVTTTTNAGTNLGFGVNMSNTGVFSGGIRATGTTTSSSTNNRVLTSNEITKSKITMGTTVSGDSGLIRDLALRKNEGDIRLRLLKEFPSITDKDVEVEIYLAFDGKRAQDQSVTVTATLDNPILEVYGNHDRVDISKGYIARAQEFNTGIAVYVGNGVTVHSKLFKDKKYYAIATRDADQADTQVFNEYRDVDNVVTMKMVGLNNSDSYVTFSTDYSGYYVYDQNMNYLGRGDERLELASKYYLANKELDVDDGEEEEEEGEEEEAPEAAATNPNSGGAPAASNANLNPGTGR